MRTIGLFFGGLSNEHEISIKSAKNIVKNFPGKRYELKLIYWDKKGDFYLVKNIDKLGQGRKKLNLADFKNFFDIALPITHGRFGEDGVLQSLFESQKIKYCGCRPLSSALCMDKGMFKQYLSGQGINQVRFIILDYALDTAGELQKKIFLIKSGFKLPIYVKPANSGSSVGITKVENSARISAAIKEALRHDKKVVVEEGLINPREVEVAVLGNEDLTVSRPGELRLAKDFYNYDDKYKLGEAGVVIPANLSPKQIQEITDSARRIYRLCGCSGFSRVDFFVSGNKVYINEINTLPGFTDISMYPMLMMDRGLSYQELIFRIIKLAY